MSTKPRHQAPVARHAGHKSRIQRLARVQVVKRKVRVKLGQAILPGGHERLAHVDEEHFRLRRRPLEAVAKRPPREPDEALHADVAQDVAALLQPALPRPRPDGALFVRAPPPGRRLEARRRELLADAPDAQQV